MEKHWVRLVDIQPIITSFQSVEEKEGENPELCISASWSNYEGNDNSSDKVIEEPWNLLSFTDL